MLCENIVVSTELLKLYRLLDICLLPVWIKKKKILKRGRKTTFGKRPFFEICFREGKRKHISGCANMRGTDWIMEGRMINWENTGDKSWSDENISGRYTDGFPCMISIPYMCVHVCQKGLAPGRVYSERAKGIRSWVLLVVTPLAPCSPSGPHRGWENCSSLFLSTHCLKRNC